MKVSLNWVRSINEKYKSSSGPAPDGVDKLVEKIGAQLGAVEEVIDLGKKYEKALIAKVAKCQKHPNADKLSLCWIDDAKAASGVKRDGDGLVQVVCGAPNVKAGQMVVWLPPGATVPSTFDKDPFVLDAREIRGQLSNGMLASPKELALGDNHEGILVLDEAAKPGQPFAVVYGLDDYVIDIENKMFTHRPDLFGQLGIARELAGIQQHAFKSPSWYREDADINVDGRSNSLKLEVKSQVPKLVPRFCAVAIKDVKVGPSPVWLQACLSAVGIRPINNIVDLTNYLMMETAQPLHAYDADKVKTGTLGVRLSKKGENLKLLGGKQVDLDEPAIVITDGQRPIGLGGVMGGADTEVDQNTKNIFLEVANFDMNQTRKTAMRYGLFTDAATRFTKNQSPRQNRAVIAKAADDIIRIAGGRIASKLIDVKSYENREKSVKTDTDFINSRLGLNLTVTEVKNLLENVEFGVRTEGNKLAVIAPFWRTDIDIPEDIVEEVGRLYGYDKLPVILPERDLAPAIKDPMLAFKSRLRQIMKQAGANEVLTYSFVHESLLKKAGQDPKQAYHIRNAISPDLQHYRLSLTPSLMDKVHPNIRAGFDNFALYEIGKGHVKGLLDDNKLPQELELLSLVTASKTAIPGSPYYAAKSILEYVLHELNIQSTSFKQSGSDFELKVMPYYEPARSAIIVANDRVIGRIGEFKPSVKQAFKLPKYSAGFDIYTNELLKLSSPMKYQPLNRFPRLEQDFNLRSSVDTTYHELTEFISDSISKLASPHGYEYAIEPLDIFQKADNKEHKQTTWRIILWHPERTLTTQETNKLLDDLAKLAKDELKAERV